MKARIMATFAVDDIPDMFVRVVKDEGYMTVEISRKNEDIRGMTQNQAKQIALVLTTCAEYIDGYFEI